MEAPKKFRCNAKKHFVTFNKTETTKEWMAEKIKEKWGNQIKAMIIARETYKETEGHHIHLGIEWHKKKNIKDANLFDFLFMEGKRSQHASIEAMHGSMKQTKEYLSKEDKDPLVIGELSETGEKKKGMTTLIAEAIAEGKTDQEINNMNPGFYLMHGKRIKEYRRETENWKNKDKKVDWEELVPIDGMTDQELEVQRWLNENIRKERRHKQAQLMIVGSPNSGKTSLVIALDSLVRIYWMPTQEQFYDGWGDDDYDLAVFDEWNNVHHQHAWLMKLLEGGPSRMRYKGGSALKRNYLPIMILTNYTIAEMYSKKVEEQALRARIKLVDCTDPLTMETVFLRQEVILTRALPQPSPSTALTPEMEGMGFFLEEDQARRTVDGSTSDRTTSQARRSTTTLSGIGPLVSTTSSATQHPSTEEKIIDLTNLSDEYDAYDLDPDSDSWPERDEADKISGFPDGNFSD